VHSEGSEYAARFVSYRSRYYTGIQIRNNPGVPLIWVGIVLMTIGIVAAFYISRTTVWVHCVPLGDDGAQVHVGATSSRHPSVFEREFTALADMVRQSGSPGSPAAS
jgi:cytochrome c biogenesis protein